MAEDRELCDLLGNPGLPSSVIDEFIAVSADDHLLSDLIWREDLTSAQTKALANRGRPGVLHTLIRFGHIPIEDVPDDVESRLAAMHREGAPAEWALELVTHPDRPVRMQVAELAWNRLDVVLLMENDEDAEIVGEIALSSRLPSDVAGRLARHPDVEVRDMLARNDEVAPEILAELLRSGGDAPIETCAACRTQPSARCSDHSAGRRRIRISALANPTTPIAGMAAFVDWPDEWARSSLAGRADLDRDIYPVLAADPDPQVRALVAENPSIPVSLMESLGQDPEPAVRRAVIENPAVPLGLLTRLAMTTKCTTDVVPRIESASEAELRELAASPRAQVRALVACRPDLPADLLTALLADRDPGVGKRLAQLRELNPDQLRGLADLHGPQLYKTLAWNPDCPPDLLRTIAEEGSAPGEVASNPRTEPEILRALTQDQSLLVRRSAWSNPSLPVDLMRHKLGLALPSDT